MFEKNPETLQSKNHTSFNSGEMLIETTKNIEILVKNNENLKLPEKAHETDACYDIFASGEPTIVGRPFRGSHGNYKIGDFTKWDSIDYIEYPTGLFMKPQEGLSIDARARSSISKYNLVLANSVGTIDNQFRGELRLRYKYIFQPSDLCILNTYVFGKIDENKIYKKGDKIAQIKIAEDQNVDFKFVEELDETERGETGFGDSGA
jgi:dUTP pyrophosphatase